MPGKKTALNHLEAVRERDTAFISANYDELVGLTEGLNYTTYLMDPYDPRKWKMIHVVDSVQIRPILRLIKGAFGEFRSSYPGASVYPLIGKYLMPNSGVVMPSPDAQLAKASTLEAHLGLCKDAERFFDRTVRQITTGVYARQPEIAVYHDADGKPLILQKQRSVNSGLTLEPIEVDGCIIPAGTIVAVDLTDEEFEASGQEESDIARLTTFSVGDGDLKVGPLRLSPWAYEDPLDRLIFAIGRNANTGETIYRPRRAKFVEGRTIDDFREAAKRVMEMTVS